jgi:dipeptidyl aminopeptidase/acylaminoacyl peptidase
LTAARVAAGSARIGEIACAGADVLWVEGRPNEAGRSALVRWSPGGGPRDEVAAPFSVRTRVHEYGGGSYTVDGGRVWFSNLADQRIWLSEAGREPRPLTPDDGRRYADAVVDGSRSRLLAVCEDGRRAGEPQNLLVSIPADGGEPAPLVQGHDFFSSPRLSPDGLRLAWLSWDHPDMPWDAATLHVADVAADGSLGAARRVAGGQGVSVFQPGWSAAGELLFASDESGWWNLQRERDGVVEPLCPRQAEFGLPQWVFGMSTWAALDDGRIACAFCEAGCWRLGLLQPESGALDVLDLPFNAIASLQAGAGAVVFAAAAPDREWSVQRLDPGDGSCTSLRPTEDPALDPGWISVPQAISYPTTSGETAHAFFYPPTNPEFELEAGEAPPLLVRSHGGPTSATTAILDLRTQYWTTRGFAVLDVNYRGSSGYGRAYRERLRGAWGQADVDDCAAGAFHLAARGSVDPARLAITGGSAGGYTTLCALAFGDAFRAGASYYGVSDLEALARDTHKFEARYLDRLVGPYPERRDRYRERSPVHHADAIACPVIFFQGSEDPVVPPSQAEAMVEALRARGIPVAYVVFEGEAHGFRRAENIAAALDAELAFYQDVLK